ncbi:MAG: DNA-processing protein DprA [Sulfurimonadaceae bacterium]|nr:DNA-processing protein DprA [Sulfurimonadaceae bacterium]
MMQLLEGRLNELEQMHRYPDTLYAIGNTGLLKRPKISIVGTRRPTPYTKQLTAELSSKLSRVGICIVSGAAMGVDGIAHQNSMSGGTIAVMGNGLDIRYPAINKELIAAIERYGLCLSQFEPGFKATNWSFVVRNEIVAALGEALIVTQADPGSGSLRSVEFAVQMGKPIYVLPQRIGESDGTNQLVNDGLAEVIYDIDAFVGRYAKAALTSGDPFLEYCGSNPTFEEAVVKFGQKVYDYELDGIIKVVNGKVEIA